MSAGLGGVLASKAQFQSGALPLYPEAQAAKHPEPTVLPKQVVTTDAGKSVLFGHMDGTQMGLHPEDNDPEDSHTPIRGSPFQPGAHATVHL